MEEKELILEWFAHVEQLATDRKTANGEVMSLQHTLDEIRCLARDSQHYVQNYVKPSKPTMDVYKFTCTEPYGGGEAIVAARSAQEAYGTLCEQVKYEYDASNFSLRNCEKLDVLQADVQEPTLISIEYYVE